MIYRICANNRAVRSVEAETPEKAAKEFLSALYEGLPVQFLLPKPVELTVTDGSFTSVLWSTVLY